jgi:hypothetical protein
MMSLLIGVGALALAVAVCAVIDPWPRPSGYEENDDHTHSTGASTLPI